MCSEKWQHYHGRWEGWQDFVFRRLFKSDGRRSSGRENFIRTFFFDFINIVSDIERITKFVP